MPRTAPEAIHPFAAAAKTAVPAKYHLAGSTSARFKTAATAVPATNPS